MRDAIAIVFDFDDTLTPDSTSSFLESIGVDVRSFWRDRVDPRVADGWDPIPAYLYEMLEESKSRPASRRITRQALAEFGSGLRYFNGVTRIFGLLRKHLAQTAPGVELEFFLVSSGIGEIVRSTSIAKHFTEIWACEFHYGPKGEIRYPRNVVSFTDKTRYLFQISKGLHGPEHRGQPFEVNRKVPAEKLLPLDQMVFVGDGYTDVPCFSLVLKSSGVAIGVYDPNSQDKWGRAWGFIEENRVSNLVAADYGTRSSLYHSLVMAIDSLARKIELKRNTYQG